MENTSVFGALGSILMGTATEDTWLYIVADLIVVLVVSAFLLVGWHIVRRLIRSKITGSLSEVSLFESFVKFIFIVLELSLVVETVFGIETSGLLTTLGVSSVVISFGLQDTVANIATGILITMHHVFAVGDVISVGDMRGVVTDVTWRETTIRDFNGDIVVIPNALLNKQSLVKLSSDNGWRHIFQIEVRPDADLDVVAQEIREKADAALDARGLRKEGMPTKVFFMDSTAFGIQCSIRIYLKDEEMRTPGRDAVMLAIQQSPWLSDCTREEWVESQEAAAAGRAEVPAQVAPLRPKGAEGRV